MFTKIDIANFGSYKNFQWDQHIATTFKRLNIIYGRNYSGKTTLSRVFEAIQHNKIPENYESTDFKAVLTCGTEITQTNLNACPYNIQVYNKHFIDENLSFLRNKNGDIKAFSTVVMGDRNRVLQTEIEQINQILGSVESQQGILFNHSQLKINTTQQQQAIELLEKELNASLTRFASDTIRGQQIFSSDFNLIKNYTKQKLEHDINSLRQISFNNNQTESSLISIISQAAKQAINRITLNTPNLESIQNHCVDLIQRELIQTQKIEAILANKPLSDWIETGITLHQHQSDKKCSFCDSQVSDVRWQELKNHFDESSQNLKKQLIAAKERLIQLINSTEDVNTNINLFAPSQQLIARQIVENINIELSSVREFLSSHLRLIEQRLENIFLPIASTSISTCPLNQLVELVDDFNRMVEVHNGSIQQQEQEKKRAKEQLRLLKVKGFVDSSDYYQKKEVIQTAKQKLQEEQLSLVQLRSDIQNHEQQKAQKISEMHDESAAAAEINGLLQHYFASNHLSLRAITLHNRSGVTFEVIRDDSVAHNLSEGECSLIAFCYFLAKIKDHTQDMIIYIDDPICSLDSNHIFFIFSAINSIITKPISYGAPNSFKYKQLFISTHNLEFVKYLRSIDKPSKNHIELMIEKSLLTSRITEIPKYMKLYITEFNYLFDKLYQCCDIQNLHANSDLIYSFGNSARRFLECYLYFKFPHFESEKYDFSRKIYKFFGEDRLSQVLCLRILHEHSHADELPDRVFNLNANIQEISNLAKFIVTKIEEKDPEQLESLLNSIDESMASWQVIKNQQR